MSKVLGQCQHPKLALARWFCPIGSEPRGLEQNVSGNITVGRKQAEKYKDKAHHGA